MERIKQPISKKPTSTNKKSSSTKKDTSRNLKYTNSTSDSDYYFDDSDMSSSTIESSTTSSSTNDVSNVEFKQLLSQLFPSKYSTQKAKQAMDEEHQSTNIHTLKPRKNTKKSKQDTNEVIEESDANTPYNTRSKDKQLNTKTETKQKSTQKKQTRQKKVIESEDEEELKHDKDETYGSSSDNEDDGITLGSKDTSSDEEDDDDEEDESFIVNDEEEDEDENEDEDTSDDDDDNTESSLDSEELRDLLNDKMNFNIVLTIGGMKDEDEDEDDTDDTDDSNVSSDNEEEEDEVEEEEEEEEKTKKQTKNMIYKNVFKKTENNEAITPISTISKYTTKNTKTDTKSKTSRPVPTPKSPKYTEETFRKMMNILELKKDEDGQNEAIQEFEKFMEVERKKQERLDKIRSKKIKKENVKTLKKLLREKNVMNDFSFFRKLSLEKQEEILKETERILECSEQIKPYRIQLIESSIPTEYKSNALRKINTLRYMDTSSGDYYKVKQWVDTFMRIPFGIYRTLPVQMSDGLEKCNDFMRNAKETLDNAVYGLDDAKMQIMQLIGQWITNPSAVGTAISIHGAMGTGKTTLVKEGIAKILNRPFAFIALGGATDSSFLEGHSYTYEGSIWGKIVEILLQSKCMNPVIYFDELDKVSDTAKGEEIIGILTHLTDTTQNSQFHDKYFSEIDFDLSKALFIFSYNDEKKVNSILRDRMYRIQTDGYDKKQKLVIARDYLIPSIEKNVGFEAGQIIVEDNTIHSIIEKYTDKEKGVRNLRRCLEIIYTKLNLYRLMQPNTKLFEDEETLNIEFPFHVSLEVLEKLIKEKEDKELKIYERIYT